MSLIGPHHRPDDAAAPPDFTATVSKRDVLSQFAEVMLAYMRHIRDPVALMRLRRDITDLVFKAVEEDERRWCVRAPSLPGPGERSRSCCGPQEVRSQMNCSWRFLRRRNKRGEAGRRTQRWEEVKHRRRASRSQFQAVQQTPEGPSDTGSQVNAQVSAQVPEMKREVEPRVVKIEEEDGTLPLV